MSVRRSDDGDYALGSNISATGSAVRIKGGQYTFTVEGTFSGTTASLQLQTQNNTWIDVNTHSNATVKYTAAAVATGIYLPAGSVRVALTGGTPSAIYAYLVGQG